MVSLECLAFRFGRFLAVLTPVLAVFFWSALAPGEGGKTLKSELSEIAKTPHSAVDVSVPPVEQLKPAALKAAELPTVPKSLDVQAGSEQLKSQLSAATTELPVVPKVPELPTNVSSLKEVMLVNVGEEVQKMVPDPERLAKWFQGHGGAILGTGTQLVAPLGYVGGGARNEFYRSHLPGLGIHGKIGMLFLRRFGLTANGALVEHLAGTDSAERGASWQLGASLLFLLFPEKKSPYLELGVTRLSFSNKIHDSRGEAERKVFSWDGRAGIGYIVVTKGEKFLYTPWAAVDIGRFTWVDEERNGRTYRYDMSANAPWHYVLNVGITFAYQKTVPALRGPPPERRPDDEDADLILDNTDRCPKEREDYYPPNPNDGCPSTDWDQDGILNNVDKCPTVPEDGLSPEPADGCPTTDRDQDGVPDDRDDCRRLREDGEGSKPDDGCPNLDANLDADQDGLVDALDHCPNEPETRNGYRDDDGCPDTRPRVVLEKTSIVIDDKIFFETGRAEVSAVSSPLLDEIAKVLEETESVELVEVQGHADDVGAALRNQRITQERADAVRRELIARGIDPTRLTAVGYGEYCPLEANLPHGGGSEKNRRVEFRVLRTSEGLTGAKTSCPFAEQAGIRGTDPNSKGPAK